MTIQAPINRSELSPQAFAPELEDKYALTGGRAYMTGTQALVRLALAQRRSDRKAGLDTRGFISGYRGSPLGGFDKELWKARPWLEAEGIVFKPGINEDLAATAVWGSQQVGLFKGARQQGVFGIWYGKGPGIDRSGDVFKHANNAGTAPLGGVLLIAGDDHAAKSSTAAHQCEYSFMDAMIPVLHPAGLEEVISFGLFGLALSRYSGCWVALKTIAETVDSSAPVLLDPDPPAFLLPAEGQAPVGGLHIRWPDPALDQEARLMRHKLYAALAFARVNRIDKVVMDSPVPRLGIVSVGKAYLDVRQALDDLGIDPAMAAAIGLRLYKVGMPWPLEREGVRAFAEGLEEILVVEEKRAVVENQIKEQLYNWREDVRPRVVGKFDESGAWLLPSAGELTPAMVARALAGRIGRFVTGPSIRDRLDWLERKDAALAGPTAVLKRLPTYCAGCPHNTSTTLPEGSRALAGIGCHYMVTWMPERATATFSQMGGEGVAWIGQAPFTDEPHVFVNLGDGTYFHSGILAIRAAVAAGVNVTYKILVNDAVAMTGGQPIDGLLSVDGLSRQLEGEGVGKIVVVSDEPGKYPIGTVFAAGVTIRHRDDLDAIQKDLRGWPGVSAILYDQTCAAEKRRRRKRGLLADPDRRVFINDLVCEGCGDCGKVSNCVAIEPLETEFGRKRSVDLSACNKDYSCLKGFCPSFVTVSGAEVRRPEGVGEVAFPPLPEPRLADLGAPYSILVTGIGGTGVVTIGALLGMAAHLEGKGVTVLDQTGLAQKNGAVTTHVRIAASQEALHAVRIAAGNANLLLGCDALTAAGPEVLAKARPRATDAVINTRPVMTAAFTRDPDSRYPEAEVRAALSATTRRAFFLDATTIATALMGDSLATNPFMIGYAWQKGLLPLGRAAIERAITLNGAAVAFNLEALLWGRRAAHDLEAVTALLDRAGGGPEHHRRSESVAETIERRATFLAAYQNAALAARYRRLVEAVVAVEKRVRPGGEALSEAVAKAYFKLLAYKDEYEVARLYSDGRFAQALAARFSGKPRLTVHLAPPLMSPRDPTTGRLRKRAFGAWIFPLFRLLARLKGLRGTPFDPFGQTSERRLQRRLITEYETTLGVILERVDPQGYDLAVEIAGLPLEMRGFGPVLVEAVTKAQARERTLLAAFLAPRPLASAAE
ncbi:indolepyruvate ferredoxin oxidoreductase family protein [Rhodospirillum rubrum]|uniref:Pyruvate ferredoxin/flavodoxin oxidoreductase n=1 Tax=Rhodospirillum rubrum (strain ATCC 11170 / ATH 1.1.1 / DSM 467 / LMG 4362 / NCIMB 8255 / S1) TaxID=269796 RepID=Q2RSB0_RHORT|nr:indolepyruvate ferredoxin oxidoreductase family protein [Rhodospirillum rubrum]ABC22985.1 Pyruvate ferredoxin/flavodoxin oxidoreductase [Rhodospirillum rubrum ATCC 11170]AEO48715.1 indolepyruvate ferredoxin oxidoreductase [Rhodospirillum rubrum F11]MBK5954611.1 indolepyruvate ferredoxin oxidoreductase [Rhodospirillum rubrum]QXG78972.1 indolepyruvate ferredoxin oxidoreductase family protein [Rhodospirillum rubrum]HAP98764.1 indolepyruvate ferredoxin oxidoreductase [Rhodospirillum rubrum]